MIADTAGASEVGQLIGKIVNTLLETKSLLTLNDDIQSLSQRGQAGGLVGQDSVKDLICFLLLGPQFIIIKKHILAVLMNLDAHAVLN